MKRLALGTAVLAAMMTVACNQEKAADTAAVEVKTEQSQTAEMAFTNDRAKQSYAMGAFVGQQMTRMLDAYKELGIELDQAQVEQGIVASLKGKSGLDEAAIQETLTALEGERNTLSQAAQAKQAEEQAKAQEAAKAAGIAFLAENAKKRRC